MGEKVRIGIGLGTRTPSDPERLGDVADGLERHGFDSLWLSERLTGEAPDPIVAMSWIAGRAPTIKFGTAVLVVPGRNPVVLAKAFASLDRLSNGRLLPAVGLGAPVPAEHMAFGLERRERSAWFEEAIPLMKRLWTEDSVDHDGDRFHLEGVTILPKPVQDPLEVWLGGIAPAELRRTARHGDGWLPSFCTPDDVRSGIATIREQADALNREIDPGHYGALVAYTRGPVPDVLAAGLKARRPDIDDVADVIPDSLERLRAMLEAYVEAGATKFVVVPIAEPDVWDDELGELAEAVLPLQT